MRPAAEKLEAWSMQRGKAAPTCFFDEASRARALVHGDDFVVTGPRKRRREGKSTP